jgi:hypothetical protein
MEWCRLVRPRLVLKVTPTNPWFLEQIAHSFWDWQVACQEIATQVVLGSNYEDDPANGSSGLSGSGGATDAIPRAPKMPRLYPSAIMEASSTTSTSSCE